MESLDDTKIEDDEVLMIVVDDENDNKIQSTVKCEIKEEISDYEGLDDCDDEDYVLETEESQSENEEVKFELDQDSVETYYVPDDSDTYKEEHINVKRKKKRMKWQRHKLRTREEQQSFVNELRESDPELKENEDLLIDRLCQEMLEVKPPEPPKDYFIMNNIMFECTECGSKKETMPAISRHWQKSHGPRYAICFACGVDFSDVTSLYRHEKRCNGPDALLVLKARARILGRKGRGRPFLYSPPKKLKKRDMTQITCERCSAVFKTLKALQDHFATEHTGYRPYRCDSCPAAYTKPLSLYKHKKSQHKDKTYLCDKCDRTFATRYNLNLHINTHLKVRLYPCPHCDKRYCKRRSLRIHVDKVHLSLPPPLACHCCPKRYFRMEELKVHMLRAHGMNLISHHSLRKTLPFLSESQRQIIENVREAERNRNDINVDSDETNNLENTEKAPRMVVEAVVSPGSAAVTKQCPHEPGELKAEKKKEPLLIKVNTEKRFDFLKCTEKFESGSEIEQQEAIETFPGDDDDNNAETQISEEEAQDDIPEDLLEYAKQLQQRDSDEVKPVIVIKDGQAVFIDKNNVGFYKRKRKHDQGELQDLPAQKRNIIKVSNPVSCGLDKPIKEEKRGVKTETSRVKTENIESTEVQATFPISKIKTENSRVKRQRRRKQNL